MREEREAEHVRVGFERRTDEPEEREKTEDGEEDEYQMQREAHSPLALSRRMNPTLWSALDF